MFEESLPLWVRLAQSVSKLLPSRAPVRGPRRVPGLSGDVRIAYTEGGVPHVEAGWPGDVFFAQGYLHASERLFQMDFLRRTARGELAEILGARPAPWTELTVAFRGWTLVDLDFFLRQVALGPVADACAEQMSPETRQVVDAYVAGVNAFLLEGPRPLECKLLGYKPRPWTASDCALTWKMLAFQLSYGWRATLASELLRKRFPGDTIATRGLMPGMPDQQDVLVPDWPGAAVALERLEAILGHGSPAVGGFGGSNAYAISGSRTRTGRAILCGDPHLPARAPVPGYLMHLRADPYDVAGMSLPGMPGVVMGHNQRILWSVTNGSTLDSSWAMERLEGEGVHRTRIIEPILSSETRIAVRGEKEPLRRTLRHTSNGPLFDHALLGEGPAGYAMALRWTGHLPTQDLAGVLAANRAQNFQEFRAAASLLGAPALNLVYADVDGHIGWQLSGLVPRFKRIPSGAVPGWSSDHEWDGIEPFEKLPFLLDPEEGFIVSANQKIMSTGDKTLQLGEVFEPPYRARRIRERLQQLHPIALDEALSIQTDRYSGFGVEVRDTFLRPLASRLREAGTALTPVGRTVLERACEWSGFAEPESVGAAALWCFVQALAEELFEPLLGERTYRMVIEQYNLPYWPIARCLERRGEPFFNPTELDQASVRALETSARRLNERCGEPSSWSLGAFRTLRFQHPLSEIPLLGRWLDIGPVPFGGDGSTPNQAAFKMDSSGATVVSSSFRQGGVVGEWDDYRAVLATGQGGDPTTHRYRDHFALWCTGRHLRIPFSPQAIIAALEDDAHLSAPPGAPAPPESAESETEIGGMNASD